MVVVCVVVCGDTSIHHHVRLGRMRMVGMCIMLLLLLLLLMAVMVKTPAAIHIDGMVRDPRNNKQLAAASKGQGPFSFCNKIWQSLAYT